MKFHKSRVLAFAACLLASAALSGAALADGLPGKRIKPTPLDQAVQDVENKEPPTPITTTTTTTTTETIEKDEPVAVTEPAPPPVPESRIVEVQPNTSFFGLSVGMYDPLRPSNRSVAFNAEYQPGVQIAGVLQPLFGAMVSVEGAMMGYAGVGIPFRPAEHVFFMPSVAVGAYKEGAGYDLGQVLAFRGGAELAYEFDDKSRIGLNAHFITNGDSFHRRDRTGIVALTYTTPITSFSGGSDSEP